MYTTRQCYPRSAVDTTHLAISADRRVSSISPSANVGRLPPAPSRPSPMRRVPATPVAWVEGLASYWPLDGGAERGGPWSDCPSTPDKELAGGAECGVPWPDCPTGPTGERFRPSGSESYQTSPSEASKSSEKFPPCVRSDCPSTPDKELAGGAECGVPWPDCPTGPDEPDPVTGERPSPSVRSRPS